jgi:type II secretory pathway pseudopilin PulG
MLVPAAPRITWRPGEAGFTLLEVTLASAILLVVMATLFAVLQSLTDTERRTQNLVSNEQGVRFVLTQLAREIRASNPMDTFAVKATYSNQIQVELGSTAPRQVVRWTYDTNSASATYEQLTRQVMADNTALARVVSSLVKLTRVRNVESSTPLFTYFGQSDQNLVTGSFTAADVGNCAIRVHLTITSDSNPGPRPFTEEQDVEVRNRLPGGLGCG